MEQMDLRAIVEKNDDILEKLDKMESLTAVLEQKANGYAALQMDKIMDEITNLLTELKKSIRETKEMTQRFSQAKKDGAIFLNNVENTIASKINKI